MSALFKIYSKGILGDPSLCWRIWRRMCNRSIDHLFQIYNCDCREATTDKHRRKEGQREGKGAALQGTKESGLCIVYRNPSWYMLRIFIHVDSSALTIVCRSRNVAYTLFMCGLSLDPLYPQIYNDTCIIKLLELAVRATVPTRPWIEMEGTGLTECKAQGFATRGL